MSDPTYKSRADTEVAEFAVVRGCRTCVVLPIRGGHLVRAGPMSTGRVTRRGMRLRRCQPSWRGGESALRGRGRARASTRDRRARRRASRRGRRRAPRHRARAGRRARQLAASDRLGGAFVVLLLVVVEGGVLADRGF